MPHQAAFVCTILLNKLVTCNQARYVTRSRNPLARWVGGSIGATEVYGGSPGKLTEVYGRLTEGLRRLVQAFWRLMEGLQRLCKLLSPEGLWRLMDALQRMMEGLWTP